MDHTDWGYKLPINEIELGNPYDEGGYSAIDNSEMGYDTCYNDEDEYVGPKAVVIDLGQL
jgi:hypothetical protein